MTTLALQLSAHRTFSLNVHRMFSLLSLSRVSPRKSLRDTHVELAAPAAARGRWALPSTQMS